MTRKSILIILMTAILLAGCGAQLVSDAPAGEPVAGVPRKGSILTPEGGGGTSPAVDTGTEAAPLGLIESATLTAQAEMTPDTSPEAVETEEPPTAAQDLGQVSPTTTQKDQPTQAATKVAATKPAATKTAVPSATTVKSNPTPTPVPSKTSEPLGQPSNTPVPEATFTEVPTATAVPTNTSPPAACNPGVNSAFENEVVSLINAERSKAGLSPLTKQSQLTAAARLHSQDMACNDFFSHTSPTTGSPFERIIAQGYSYSWAGENIAAGYGSAAAVVDGWMNSAGHRANILNENFTEIGAGYAYWSGSTYGSYITAVFARP